MIRQKLRMITDSLHLEQEEVFLETGLRMFLLMLLLFVNDIPLAGIVIPAIVLPGLLIKAVTFNRFYWLFLSAFFTLFYLILGLRSYLPNHKYIFAFAVIAATLTLFAKENREEWKVFFIKSCRWIIGFCFFYATVGKFLAPEFLDGSFFEFTSLTDERFHGMTSVLTGIDTSTLFAGYKDFTSFLSSADPSGKVTLVDPPNLRAIGLFLAYWTIFIEGMIAISFLAPAGTWLHRYRDWFLIIFIITTYPIATVPGFATTLAAMAFCQSFNNGKANYLSYFYLLIFVSIPLFKIPFLRIISIIT